MSVGHWRFLGRAPRAVEGFDLSESVVLEKRVRRVLVFLSLACFCYPAHSNKVRQEQGASGLHPNYLIWTETARKPGYHHSSTFSAWNSYADRNETRARGKDRNR